MDIIEITESNYREYQSLNIVAFSFAYEGAMGEMGAIYIICHDGQIYHANYCQGDDPLDPSHINDIIPVLKDISWRMFDCLSNNPDWKPVDLFAGNNLLVANEIYEEGSRSELRTPQQIIPTMARLYVRSDWKRARQPYHEGYMET